MLTMRVRQLLERNFKNLGTLPSIISSLIRVLNNPRSSTRDLANIISADPVLSARLLRLVNSAHYGLQSEVIDIQHAVGLVGFNVIRSFTFCITLFDNIFTGNDNSRFNKEDLWFHSLGTASAARHISQKLYLTDSPDYFVAGLMHDLGKIFMFQFLPFDFFKTLEKAEKEGISFHEAETELLVTDHAEIGACIMESWKLPEKLVTCVRYHHSIVPVDDCYIWSEVIILADSIVKYWKIGFSGDYVPDPYYEDLKKKYRLSNDWIDGIFNKIDDEIIKYSDIITKKNYQFSR